MAISDDWAIDYVNKLIEHVDGILPFDGRTLGNSPAAGEYIRGDTSGAVAKVLAGADADSAAASGNLRLTNVTGRFQNDETLTLLSELPFDTVDNNTGSRAWIDGDTLGGTTTEAGVVRATEYNNTATAGEGTVYLSGFTLGAWANNIQIDNDTITQTSVALVNGSPVDNSGDTWDGVVNLTGANADGLIVPGTANTNDSVIIHYDAGTQAIPVGAIISDGGSASAQVQEVIGVTATGSLRLVDYDSTTTFADGDTVTLTQVVNYDAQVAGQVFSVGDVVVGATSGATGRILAVIDDGDSTGRLILADESGTWDAATPDDIQVDGTKIAEVENTTFTLAAATVNLPTGQGIITEQTDAQGGLLDTGESLNIVRSFNALYTYLQDTFDELAQLDDTVPMSAAVKDGSYTMINGWVIPDLSLRFLQSGALTDEDGNNTWNNPQSLGSIADISSDGYLLTATNPTPQPQIYVEQDGAVIDTFWMHGNIDILVKVRSNTDVNVVDDTVPGLGQNINSGILTFHTREYGRTYNVFETTAIGTVAPIPFATANDLNNNTGTHTLSYTGTGGFTVGEEITTTTAAVGIVTAEDTTGNTLDYILKTTTDFANTNVITGTQSQATCTVSGSSSTLVAGYGFDGTNGDVKVMTVDRDFTGGTTSGTFVVGEDILQTGSGATGYLLRDNGAGTLYVMDDTGTFNGTGLLTGQESSATYTPTATAAATTFGFDIDEDGTDESYAGCISGNANNATAVTIEKVYEWCKYLTRREESTETIGGPGTATGTQGRIYRYLNSTYTEVASGGCPIGTFAGGTMFGAQGWLIDNTTIDSSDLQSVQLIDTTGTTFNPPNLQAIQVTGLDGTGTGDRVAVYRTTAAASTTIMTTEWATVAAAGSYNGSGDSEVRVTDNTRTLSAGALPNDVPSTGVLRIDDGNTGVFLSYAYTSVDRATATFTLSGTLPADLDTSSNVFVVFIEEEATASSVSNSVIYVSDVPLLVRCRQKGILPFETTSTFAGTGASVGVVRTTDTIVNLP